MIGGVPLWWVRVRPSRQGFELVIYGDSIMETLRGTDHGLPCGRAGCPEGPSILRAHFGDRWRTAVVATGGGALIGAEPCGVPQWTP